ncbi:MAG: hypothetical protein K8S27_04670 [Candidatus Omnitrophica bacterium]|nr:hypothetical protein [Candidatus Omnitrophota bacterium]
MNHRIQILRDVYKFYNEKGPGNYGLAHTFPSFTTGDERYLAALNQLLREKLILGVSMPDNSHEKDQMAIGLNPDRLNNIRKELSPWHMDPKIVIPIIVGMLGLIWAVVSKLF